MKALIAAVILGLFLTSGPSPARGADSVRKPSVIFLSPFDVTGRPFWQLFLDFMRTAADDLGLDLRVVPSENKFKTIDSARAVLAGEVPDYAIYSFLPRITVDMLPLLEQAGVNSIICNTLPVESDSDEVGLPGGKYAHWIALIAPDDREAGYVSTRRLIEQGTALGLTAPDGKLHMAAIGAPDALSSAHLRREGMEEALIQDPRAVLDRFVSAEWLRDKARYKTERMLDLYPLARVYWAASDRMALGVLDAAEAKGLRPSENFLVSGIGWTEEGLRAVREGRLALSVGGHFMEGAWALILALDHYNGHALLQPVQRSRMQAITRANLEEYLPVLDRANWSRIDFKAFSKTWNPKLKGYGFTPDAVVRQLNRK